MTHVRRHHEHYHSRGGGHLYQGRFKSFPIQDDAHFRTVCRYVEANPLRAKLVGRAQDWRYSSLRWWPEAQRAMKGVEVEASSKPTPPVELSDWPVPRPKDWLAGVNRPIEASELSSLRESARRGRPFGDERWVARTAKQLALENTLRLPGRPAKERHDDNQ